MLRISGPTNTPGLESRPPRSSLCTYSSLPIPSGIDIRPSTLSAPALNIRGSKTTSFPEVIGTYPLCLFISSFI
ncbi:hypothetical protein [Wolbachia endosymbiont of Cardiocondyla obscurior]|uniref:hypothetical protein n=1 Tax=Wolbachia endosymbiont of Cardiocondyla obscurior TaxID=2687307 RepID=UPI00272B7D65|nr:hypothetical protein [Wolbachia endosymbiont of Cardiocondyla obscurior]